MRRLWSYIRPMRVQLFFQILIKSSGSLMDLALPFILSYVIDEVVPLHSRGRIFLWGGVMIICSVLAWLGNIIPNRMASNLARKVTRQLRHDLYASISYLSCEQVDEFTVPSLEARLTSDTYNIHQMVSMSQRMGLRTPILIIGGIICTVVLDPALAGALACALPLIFLIVYFVNKIGIPLYAKTQETVDRLVCTVRENCTGIRVIKALSKTESEKVRFEAVNNEVVAKETKASVTMATSNPLINLVLNTGLVCVIVLAAYRVNIGAGKPGTIVAFITYFTIILNACMSVSRLFVMISKGLSSANRVDKVMSASDTMEILPKEPVETPYHIAFDHVNFSYKKVKNNLNDICFALKKGQILGIIGPTGCGKSTIVNLLLRFYDVDSGTIRINGLDIRSLSPQELRTHLGIVFQNDSLFADTVLNNVRFGRDISEEEIRQALQDAQGEFVFSEKGGMDFELTPRGSNLSGGQKQRLLIARALAASPDILILDDSSSALDYKTDAQLRAALKARHGDTTTIIVAQRISSIRHADLILVMDEGNVIGSGTHEELMRTCPAYQNISKVQMGDEKIA